MKYFKLSILLSLIATVPLLQTHAQNYPNILFILADDMGVDALAGYNIGANTANTPHIDQLMESGVSFTNVWATPVCTATRASILTGKYGINNGVNTVPGVLSTDETSIFKELSERTNGAYQSCVVGKWHVSRRMDIDHPYAHGADNFMGVIGAGVDDYYQWEKIEEHQQSTYNTYATSYFTDYAASWINQQTQPWLMWLAHVSPHTPFHTPPQGTYSQTSTNTRPQQFRAMIESLDYEIGRLLDAIPQETLDNTVIIFLGDNGTPGSVIQTFPSGRGKSTLYQGGIQVPMIVSGKGVSRKNETEDALINISDLFATIAHFADPSVGQEGMLNNSLSFKHLLDHSEGEERTYNYMGLGANGNDILEDGFTVRDQQYKLIQAGTSKELYDLLNDPFELNNLLDISLTTEQETIKSKLENILATIRGIPHCGDGVQNGNETGVDCGGDCTPCSSDNSEEKGRYQLVHTGVKTFFDNSSILTTTPSNTDPFYWQDAGRIINEPSYTNNGDGTITDNVTGLMWEKDMGEKLTYTEAVAKAKSSTLGGFTDWRIPTIKELYSLILFTGKVRGETAITSFIDSDYFNQPIGDVSAGEREIDAQTWSSTHYTGLTMNGDSTVFGVNFIDGRIKGYPKYQPRTQESNAFYFRMVRGNPDYGKNQFVDNDNGTITDNATQLMWQQADDGVGRDWASAISYCENLQLGGHSDWHLPNAKELHSIVDYARSPSATNSAAIDPLFSTTEITDPDGNPGQYPYFWSTTTHQDGANPYDAAVYIAFGEAQGQINNRLLDVHGAGAQRSDPKTGNQNDYPQYFGPQGDVQIVYNHCRCVRNVEMISTSYTEPPKTLLKVFPNPSRAFLTIELPEGVRTLLWANLYDANGTLLVQKVLQERSSQIEVQALPAGVYFLVVSGKNTAPISYKVIKID